MFLFYSYGTCSQHRLDSREQLLSRLDPVVIAKGQELLIPFVEQNRRYWAWMILQQLLQVRQLRSILGGRRDLDKDTLA